MKQYREITLSICAVVFITVYVLFLTPYLEVTAASAQTDETQSKAEASDPAVSEQSDDKSADEAQDPGSLAHVSPQTVQFCQGKYEKKGIGGVEIITVECPESTDKCSCEVNKSNLTERVNCGGVVKNASKGSNLLSCDSRIVGN